jgi:hypothetical protein
MVRVGGGWVALDEFLVKNDPCRGELPSIFSPSFTLATEAAETLFNVAYLDLIKATENSNACRA